VGQEEVSDWSIGYSFAGLRFKPLLAGLLFVICYSQEAASLQVKALYISLGAPAERDKYPSPG
jgi:hypothetical protein